VRPWAHAAGRVSIIRNLLKQSRRGFLYGRDFSDDDLPSETSAAGGLENYFDEHLTGPGLWKWRHYFPIYEKHFEKFRGQEVHIVEIGIFSGGSLRMWREYFGEQVHIYGVDIEPSCKAYESPGTRVFVGDQSDPTFWKKFIREVPAVDIVIDDGGHQAFQQIPTLEALLPHVRPGGVYLCEDVQGQFNDFHDYVSGLSRNLNAMGRGNPDVSVRPSEFQKAIESIHFYPFVTVIEKRSSQLKDLVAPKHGTEWQPFLEGVSLPET